MKQGRIIISVAVMLGLALNIGCQKEMESPNGETNLREMTFHAGWDDDTKTVLQEDGKSIYWSPGDEISLFVGTGNDGGFKLSSTNVEPSANVDFVGQANEKLNSEKYVAVYPYSVHNYYNGTILHTLIPSTQVAKDGGFEKNTLVSYAVSDDENLNFKNICGGIKFSVKTAGIQKVEIATGNGAYLAGEIWYRIEGDNTNLGNTSKVIITAPKASGFEVGKYYYAVVAPNKINSCLYISYYTEDKVATLVTNQPVEFKKGVFKRLYNGDDGLVFKEICTKAALGSSIFYLAGDKSSITEVNFYVNSDKTTDQSVNFGYDGYKTVYFEQEGTVANYYTSADVYQVFSAEGMFEGCTSLQKVDFSNWDTSLCTDMGLMFQNCSSIESLNLSNLDVSNVRDMQNMFSGCEKLRTLSITNLNPEKAENMHAMFYGCSLLTQLDFTSWHTSSCTDMSGMFNGCKNLTIADVSGFNTQNVTNMNSMFCDCWNLQTIDVSKWNTENVTSATFMFGDCHNLHEIDMSACSLSELIDASNMFNNCYSIERVTLPNTETPKLQKMESMFWKCRNLRNISFNKLSTSNVVSMKYLFCDCASLTELNLSSFNTSNVESMYGMFMGCTSLLKLDLSKFNTQNTSEMDFMFSGCYSMKDLNINSFSAAKIEHAYSFMQEMSNLTKLDLGEFDMSSVVLSASFQTVGNNVSQCHIRSCAATKNKIISDNSAMGTNPKYVWYGVDESLPDEVDGRIPGLYYSTDYSKDKTVILKQKATEGNGIDIVIMGDGYSDRLIADGTYDNAMNNVIDAIFAAEPYKTFKNMFNVYVVYAVSENEILGNNTAFSSYDQQVSWAGSIGAKNTSKIKAMSCMASNKGDMREIATIVVLNSDTIDGAAWTSIQTRSPYEIDPLWDDYHGGESIAFISGPFTSFVDYTSVHEFGHSFGMLADEYSKGLGTIDDATRNVWLSMCNYGMYKNIDFVGDSDTVKWHHLLGDSRYAGTGLGCYEGGSYYDNGVWRPTDDSIMNGVGGHYNAPSREAIYYRIHKLAYGKDWVYDYDAFVDYDAINIAADKAGLTKACTKSCSVLMNHRNPFVEVKKEKLDGETRVTIITN